MDMSIHYKISIEPKVEKFKESMLSELESNSPTKGLITEFKDFNGIITELEYHKAKMMIAIRMDNKQAAKEYIADSANFLFCLGNLLGLYDDDFVDKADNESFEINKVGDIFIKVNEPSLNQKKINLK